MKRPNIDSNSKINAMRTTINACECLINDSIQRIHLPFCTDHTASCSCDTEYLICQTIITISLPQNHINLFHLVCKG